MLQKILGQYLAASEKPLDMPISQGGGTTEVNLAVKVLSSREQTFGGAGFLATRNDSSHRLCAMINISSLFIGLPWPNVWIVQ